jgi:hypothetical protein
MNCLAAGLLNSFIRSAQYGRAIDGYKRPGIPVTGGVDGSGEKLLAGARFTEDEDRHVANRSLLRPSDREADGFAVADDLAEARDFLRAARCQVLETQVG